MGLAPALAPPPPPPRPPGLPPASGARGLRWRAPPAPPWPRAPACRGPGQRSAASTAALRAPSSPVPLSSRCALRTGLAASQPACRAARCTQLPQLGRGRRQCGPPARAHLNHSSSSPPRKLFRHTMLPSAMGPAGSSLGAGAGIWAARQVALGEAGAGARSSADGWPCPPPEGAAARTAQPASPSRPRWAQNQHTARRATAPAPPPGAPPAPVEQVVRRVHQHRRHAQRAADGRPGLGDGSGQQRGRGPGLAPHVRLRRGGAARGSGLCACWGVGRG
jgi:hypothetical protein